MSLVDQVTKVMTPAGWGRLIGIDDKWIQSVDAEVLAKLPSGSEVVDIVPHGTSHWSQTAKISTRQQEGSPEWYFLKLSEGEDGKHMVKGEFASMKALHSIMPDFVPRPIGCGSYASNPDIHFFLCDYINMQDGLPEIEHFVDKLAELHEKGIASNGKYGFELPTYKGIIPQYTDWHDTWEEAYHHSMKWFVYAEEKSQGPDDEMTDLCNGLFEKVIPRLLRPLETGGRQIKPRLIHGDLWAGNCATAVATGKPLIFDAACLYAHRELEMAAWRPTRHLLGKEYKKAYFQRFPPSAPEEDQDDRNLLYYLRWDLKSSALFPGKLRYREMAKETMRTLIAKYPDGYEGWAKERGEEPVQRVYSPTSYSLLRTHEVSKSQ